MTVRETVTCECSRWEHREFRLLYDSATPQIDVDSFVCFLQESVEGGTRYEDGQLIGLGSMLLRLVAANGWYDVQEPDMVNIPIIWKAGVTQSLRLLRLQKDVVESVSLGDELDFPSIRNSLVIGADLPTPADGYVLERLDPGGSDSGWFIGRLNSALDYNDAANLRRVSVYQAILSWPRVAAFLALPSGSRVEVSIDELKIHRNGKPLEVQKGSFLDVC